MFHVITEPRLTFDHDPSALYLTHCKEACPMNKTEYVTFCIQHHEDFPSVGEITLEDAKTAVDNAYHAPSVPLLTAEEFMILWNQLVHDPAVIRIE